MENGREVYNPFGKRPATGLTSMRPGNTKTVVPRGEPMVMTSRSVSKIATDKKNEQPVEIDDELESLHIRWTDDYDIVIVHTRVLQYLKHREERKVNIRNRLKGANLVMKTLRSVEEISNLRLLIADLQEELQKLEKVLRLDYLAAVSDIVAEYKELNNTVPVIMGRPRVENSSHRIRKAELVEAYFNECSKYYKLDVVRVLKSSALCKLCNGIVVDRGEQYICSDCHSVKTKIEVVNNEPHDEGSGKKSNYESGGNFRDFVMQFMMTFPISIPERLLDKIRKTASQYQGFDIKTQLTKPDLVRIMKELHLGSWYKHLNKIYFLLTGKKPADISAYSQNVILRGLYLNEIYNDIKADDRSNFLHGLHLLWLFLKNEGCEPDMTDFVLLKSRDVELNNLETLRKGFAILRKTHPEFTWTDYELP